ncbi:MAG: universal stress protein [Bacteroidetes bacterium]|nr:universal stress protein [Bacteroidota bacterium]
MNYKDILVYLDDGKSNAERVKVALLLAKNHNAHLTGVTLVTDASLHKKLSANSVSTSTPIAEAEKITQQFNDLAAQQGISSDSHVITGAMTDVTHKIAQFARNFDLLILRQANPEYRDFTLIKEVTQEVILLSGRPIFFMPYIGAHRMPCKKAMIAWDGSPTATRAVHDALPMLSQIDDVVILVVEEGKQKTKKGELLAQNLVNHLKRHDVNAKVNRVASGSIDVPTILLNEISDNDIDLLVMGGYGTPSLKQKIFGGVTRTLLQSMLIPVFMSH